MRVAFLGVSHWHTHSYIEAVADYPGATLVGVADPVESAAREWAAKLGTAAYADYRAMIDETKPDAVFALGRHSDMAAEARYLIEAGIPFGMEKPCGVNVAQVEEMAALARERKAFAAIPFTYRYSDLRRLITETTGEAEMTYGMFRQVPGPTSRYDDWNVSWNLDRKQAGGGCTLNLSIHFFDLAKVLAPSVSWEVKSAVMSNELSGVDVEDFSAALLEGGDGRRASIETGYFFPVTGGELLMSVCVGDTYYKWDGSTNSVTITHGNGRVTTHPAKSSQAGYYGKWVLDTLRLIEDGGTPDADLDDMVYAARMAERAYRAAGFTESMV